MYGEVLFTSKDKTDFKEKVNRYCREDFRSVIILYFVDVKLTSDQSPA